MTEFTPRSIEIVFPYAPPTRVNANKRGHSRSHAAAIKELREDAMKLGLALRPPGWEPLDGMIEQTMFIMYPAGQQLPDLDNSISACKAIIDGLAEAGIIRNDNRIRRYREVEQAALDGAVGWVRITFTEYAPWRERPEATRTATRRR